MFGLISVDRLTMCFINRYLDTLEFQDWQKSLFFDWVKDITHYATGYGLWRVVNVVDRTLQSSKATDWLICLCMCLTGWIIGQGQRITPPPTSRTCSEDEGLLNCTGDRVGDLWMPTAVAALCFFPENPLLGQGWHGEENLRPRSQYYIYRALTCPHSPPAGLLSNKTLFLLSFL
jgi:hypothetical protein